MSCLNINKAAGMDQIPEKSLKEAADVLAYSLFRIISLSVKLSVFTEEHEIAKLKPLFKKVLSPSKTDPKNYRLISLLPVVSTIIEKSIQYQLKGYPKGNSLLCIHQ